MSKVIKLSKSLMHFEYLKRIKKVSNKELGCYIKDRLTYLGPTYIKIGQFLSTRSDIIDKYIISELKKLQDDVYPIEYSKFNYNINEDITDINLNPIGKASISQVYKAKYKNTDIVLKMKRPNIKEEIEIDFKIILMYINILKIFSTDRKLKEFELLFTEYYKVLKEEIDFENELNNTIQFKENVKNKNWLTIPEVYKELSDDNVLVMEYVESTKLSYENIKKLGLSPKKIAKKLIETYIEQMIIYGFVHLDPHGGNIGITKNNKIVFYDFGMIFKIDKELQLLFKKLLVSVYNQDIDTVCETIIAMELIIIEPEDIPYFKLFLASLLSYIQNSDLNQFKLEYIDKINTYSTPFIISSKFILFLRGISILEGLCKELDSDFNFKDAIEPYFNDLMFDINYIETKAKSDIDNFFNTQTENKINDIKLKVLQSNIKNIETKMNDSNINYNNILLGYMFIYIMESTFNLGLASTIGLSVYVLLNKK